MENSKVPSTMKNMYIGKHNSLPPKSPFPSIAPFYPEYAPNALNGSKGMIPKHRDGNSLHQRTSSEILVMEEQPSWLDDLLDEPETPVKRTHRRSSSDSFAYIEAANANIQHAAQVEYTLRNMNSASSWASQEFDLFKQNPMIKNEKRVWVSSQNASNHTSLQEINRNKSTTPEKQDAADSGTQDSRASLETDTKRSKQQFAQRSRVRKLQYIAELERNVQALQAEGSDVSGEVKFLNQRSLILTMENKALKQRLENLAQEQLIKYLEHEVLEREIGRLRGLYKQQQPPPTDKKPVVNRGRTKSMDNMESQFANLSLKNKESGAVRDAVSGSLRI